MKMGEHHLRGKYQDTVCEWLLSFSLSALIGVSSPPLTKSRAGAASQPLCFYRTV